MIDISGLADALEEAWGSPVQVADVKASTVGASRSNLIFTATCRGESRRLVATIAAATPSANGDDHQITAEAAVIELAEGAGVAIPHVELATCDPSFVGAPLMVTSFVEGETIPRRVLREVAHHGIGEGVARQVGESLARLHSIKPEHVPRELSNRAGGMAHHIIDEIRTTLHDLPQARPALELGLSWMQRNLPNDASTPAVVHRDVRTGNIVVGPDGLRAILDWELALPSGDPMQDLAWPTLRMWRFGNDHLRVGGFASMRNLAEGYEAGGGVFDEDRVQWWTIALHVWWALGLARQAVRYLDGESSSIVHAASGRRVSEVEWDMLCLLRRVESAELWT